MLNRKPAMKLVMKGLLVSGAVLFGAALTDVGPFGNAYFFGDSLTDCCAFGRTTNGPNWSDLLPSQIGESYTATLQTNLAVGGAQSGSLNVLPAASFRAPTGFLSQVRRFTSGRTSVGPNDVACIWIGTNDIWPSTYRTALAPVENVGSPRQPLGPQPSVQALTSYIIDNIRSGITGLEAVGFRNFVLLSPYDLAQSTVVLPQNKALGTAYSDTLTAAVSRLYTPGVNTYFVDVRALLQQVQADPGAYGFLHTTAMDSCSAANCTSQPQAVQDTYIFNDNVHFTTAFDRLIASHAAAIINAGRTIRPPVPDGR